MKSKKIKIFMTGGTGFLGKEVCHLLNSNPDIELHTLSRSTQGYWQGDLSLWNAGLDLKKLVDEKYDVFLHLAGLYDLNASYQDIIINNVFGTNTALKLTQELNVPVFINASSVAAVSNILGDVTAYTLNLIEPFPDPYSEGKALTEIQIKNWPNESLKKINLRLGILVGNNETGEIQRIDGPYKAVEGFSKLKKIMENWPGTFLIPGNDQVRLPLVPVNIAANAVVQFINYSINHPEPGYFSYHVTPQKGIKVEDFYNSIMSFLKFKRTKFKLVKELPINLVANLANRLFEFPKEQLKYALRLPHFSSEEANSVLGEKWCPEFSDYENQFWSGYEKFISNS